MRRAAQANWSRLPNHNPPRFYTAWTRSGHRDRNWRRRLRATSEPRTYDKPRSDGF